jgi:hypothetical protein
VDPQSGLGLGAVRLQDGLGNTVTVKEQVAVFPQASVAVAVTTVVPTGNTVPDGGTTVGVIGPAQLSVAVTI